MKIGNNWRIVIVFLNANVKFFFFFFHFLLQHLACASALLLLLSFLPVRRSEEKIKRRKGGGSRTSWKTRDVQNDEGCGCCGLSDMLESCPPVESFSPCVSGVRETLVAICEAFPTHTHTHTQNPDKMGKIILKNKKETDQAPSSLSGGKGGLTDDAINLSIEVCFAKKKEKVLISYFGLFIVSFPPVCRKRKLQYHGTILFCFVGRVE